MSTIVLFRNRLRPEAQEEYGPVAAEIGALAREQPGLIAVKTFSAADGERITIAEFTDEAAVTAWRENARHREAQAMGRDRFYAEYHVQVCEVRRDYQFSSEIAL